MSGEPHSFSRWSTSHRKPPSSKNPSDFREADATTTTTTTTTATQSSDEWAGDDIPAEKLEALRSKMGLSRDQMKEVVETSKKEYQQTCEKGGVDAVDIDTSFDTTSSFFKSLNRLMYMGMAIAFIHVLNRDYDNIATVWFVKTFPKEAGVFGIQL